jgi:protocatechuate 3,4-dioxygenase beta subunit
MKPLLGYRKPAPGTQPNHLYPPYVSSIKRAPKQPLISVPVTLSEITGPSFPKEIASPKAFDLTRQHKGEPLGERIGVRGRVVDEDGRPIRNTLVEIWQANAAGRYLHTNDQHNAPLDPNFTGEGRTFTDEDGRYGFVTCVCHAAGHPDVFSRRSAARFRPHLSQRSRRSGTPAPDFFVRLAGHRTRSLAGLPF